MSEPIEWHVKKAIAAERERCAKALERAHAKCNTLNLLHGAAIIRAISEYDKRREVRDQRRARRMNKDAKPPIKK